MSSVEFAGEVIPISVVRSARRRTVGITVKESGEVVLRIPPQVSEADALRFAQEKAEWIVRHREKFAALITILPSPAMYTSTPTD